MINAIIFDAEGVIIDTEKMWDQAQEEFLRRRGIAYERMDIKHTLSGKSQPARWQRALRSAASLAAGSGGFQPPVPGIVSNCTPAI
jgi:beta-phosphoglucomutase-like phosphatase (HAD superfamily)